MGIEHLKFAWAIIQMAKTRRRIFPEGYINADLLEYLLQAAQKGTDARPLEILRSEAYFTVRCNDEG